MLLISVNVSLSGLAIEKSTKKMNRVIGSTIDLLFLSYDLWMFQAVCAWRCHNK